MAVRGEYIRDFKGLAVNYRNSNAFSLNADYSPYKNVWLRVEGKYLQSDFLPVLIPADNMVIVTGSLAVAF